jgi:shikimate kinase
VRWELKNNIILIGFMGCGKSTVGKRLAKDYGIEFLDTDAWIEEREQVAISEIFANKGEPYFRQLETNCLEVLLEESAIDGSKSSVRKVVSVGGGLPMKEENRQLLKKLGTVIYL